MSTDASEDLYGLPLDQFIPSRAVLVKALRAEKRREEASEVAALRKPSVAAWVVNQLVRTQPKAVQALFDAGDDLARAQAQAAAGKGGGDAMRGATHRQRDAVRELLEAAEGLLSSEGQGVSQATTERVGETLRAAANDDDARRHVAGGCLTRELSFVGVGFGGLTAPAEGGRNVETRDPKARGGQSAKARDPKAARDANANAKAKAEAEAKAARERTAARKLARRTEAEARRAATRADKELAAAQARQEEAAASLREAEILVGAAAQRAENAAAELTAAEQALSDLAES